MATYYEILGVSNSADQSDIKAAYHRLAHIYHPDKPGGSHAKFLEISKAYTILSDPLKRRDYDQVLVNFNSPGHGKVYNPGPTRNPNACQVCGLVLPLKKVKLFQNIGMIFTRQSKFVDANLCKDCIDRYFARFTFVTLVLGWWGMISFFVTIGYLLNNSFVFIKTLSMKRS
jgi:curved DNA-binding protein CbpA